jgi:probable phosphoglycerate mutase
MTTTDALPGTRGRRRVFLMRHGDVSYIRGDGRTTLSDRLGLTPEGQHQARLMRDVLAEVAFELAVHTGVERTIQTLDLVLEGKEVPRQAMPELREIRAGDLESLTPERYEAEFVYGFENAAAPGARFAGGETFVEFRDRTLPAFERLLLQPGWRNLLMVCHGGTNVMIIAWITGGGLAGMGCVDQDPCCLNVLDFDVIDGQIVRKLIRTLNATPYNLVKAGLHLSVIERLAQERARGRSEGAAQDR